MHQSELPSHDSKINNRIPTFILRLKSSASRKESLKIRSIPRFPHLAKRRLQWHIAAIIDNIRVTTVFEKEAEKGRVIVGRCIINGRRSPIILLVDVRAQFDQS